MASKFRNYLLLIAILLILLVIFFFVNRKKLVSRTIQYTANHTWLQKSPWEIKKLKLSQWSLDKKTKTIKNKAEKIRIIKFQAPVIQLAPEKKDKLNKNKSNKNKSNNKVKSITLNKVKFSSNVQYPVNSNKESFKLHADSVYIQSDELRESPILMLARNIIRKHGIEVKDVNIHGYCQKNINSCTFDSIKLGEKNLRVTGSGTYFYKKGDSNFDLILSFPALPKLKIPIELKTVNHKLITKVKKLSGNDLLQMI
jgi:hypothetical protein